MANHVFATVDRAQIPDVDVVARNTADLGVPLDRLLEVAANVLGYTFGPVWGPAHVKKADDFHPDHWGIAIFDDADQAEGWGIADRTPGGHPMGHVAVKTQLEHGNDPVDAFFRELFGLLVDPSSRLAAFSHEHGVVAYEPCDPVGDSKFPVGGVQVPNFVFPAYFDEHTPDGVQLDFVGLVRKPFQILPGGWLTVQKKNEWARKFAKGDEEPAKKMPPGLRGMRRSGILKRGGRTKGGLVITQAGLLPTNTVGPV